MAVIERPAVWRCNWEWVHVDIGIPDWLLFLRLWGTLVGGYLTLNYRDSEMSLDFLFYYWNVVE